MQTTPIRADLTSQTHDIIRDAIISGELEPGTALAQLELATRLGVSRQPVSHALKLLKAEGLVVDRGRKGQMVAPVDAQRLLELYQVRGSLDRLAARLAAARVPQDPAVCDQLMQLVERGCTAAEESDKPELVSSDMAFHRLLHDASGNAEIATITDPLWPHLLRSMHTVLADRNYWKRVWSEHRDIASAVIAGDPERAGNLAAQHAEHAGQHTYDRLTQQPAQQ